MLDDDRYPRRGYDEEEEARAAMKIVRDNTMVSYERLATLWQQVRYLDRAGLSGALVECGTWKGGAVGLMALAHRASGAPTRAVHLFDSFEGLPEPDAACDGQRAARYAGDAAAGALVPISRCIGTLEENRQLLETTIGYPAALLHYHIGWFQHTLPADAASLPEIALLRLDGDWYDSTRVCLTHLHPRVRRGGLIVIDDYGHWPGCRRAVDELIERLERPVLLNHIDSSGRYIVVT